MNKNSTKLNNFFALVGNGGAIFYSYLFCRAVPLGLRPSFFLAWYGWALQASFAVPVALSAFFPGVYKMLIFLTISHS
jgi:hypothetical protein